MATRHFCGHGARKSCYDLHPKESVRNQQNGVVALQWNNWDLNDDSA